MTATTTAAPRRSGGNPLQRHQRRTAYLFVLPFMLVFAGMIVLPLGYALVASVFRTRLFGGTVFIGLANFGSVLVDPRFYEGLGRVLLYMAIDIPLTVGLALVFALFFDSRRVRGGSAARLLMFLPNAVPIVVATLMWGYIYGNDYGPIAQVFHRLGLGDPNLLSSGNVLGSIVNIAFWSALGTNMIILYAALQSVPQELYEAATVDGAGQLRIAWSIKIPSIRPTILLCTMLSVIIGFQLFNEPNLLSSMAPGVIDTAFTPNIYIYNVAFSSDDIGRAAAMSIILGLLIIIVSLSTQLGSRRKEEF
jgi:multiple sugar transport system permease protein